MARPSQADENSDARRAGPGRRASARRLRRALEMDGRTRAPVRLDAILAARPAVLTARRPDAGLTDFCRRHGLVLTRISAPGTGAHPGPGTQQDAGWIDVRLVGDAMPAGLRALAADPALTVLVRPDRVAAAVGTRSRLPHLPWYIPAAAGPERPATAPAAAHPESAFPVTTIP